MKIKEKTADRFLFFVLFTACLFVYYIMKINMTGLLPYITLVVLLVLVSFLKGGILKMFKSHLIPTPSEKMKTGPSY